MNQTRRLDLDTSIQLPELTPGLLREADLKDLALRQGNQRDLLTLQHIIHVEEDNCCSVDEVLARVLDFYRRFVPFERTAPESNQFAFDGGDDV